VETLRLPAILLLITSICLGSPATGAAQTGAAAAGTPDAVVRELYRVYNHGKLPLFDRKGRRYQLKFFDKRLADLVWKDITETPEGEMGHIDFDPLYNTQDDTGITNFRVGAPVIQGDRATVIVSFNQFRRRRRITFRMHNTSEGWKVENILYPGENADLIKILSEPL
jgi:hypothetical protein